MWHKTIYLLLSLVIVCSCGPSPEAMAKKNCALHKKFQEAESKGDSATMMKYVDEMAAMDKDLQEKHKNNPEWLSTYSLERDACIIQNMKKNE